MSCHPMAKVQGKLRRLNIARKLLLVTTTWDKGEDELGNYLKAPVRPISIPVAFLVLHWISPWQSHVMAFSRTYLNDVHAVRTKEGPGIHSITPLSLQEEAASLSLVV